MHLGDVGGLAGLASWCLVAYGAPCHMGRILSYAEPGVFASDCFSAWRDLWQINEQWIATLQRLSYFPASTERINTGWARSTVCV
jgi:hypothetical protein